jgi:stage III sporulation protein SpoIIIAA/Fe-S-cluster-containing hydrogenase component 2
VIIAERPYSSLRVGNWFKLIGGASSQNIPSLSNLALIYTLAGADCLDVSADPAVIHQVKKAIDLGHKLAPENSPPLLMVSLSDGSDPHFRKASFPSALCPLDCPRPCLRICPVDAITQTGISEELCYGCGRCAPVCPIGIIELNPWEHSVQAIGALLAPCPIDAVEIHTHATHLSGFQELWQGLAPLTPQLKLVSISFPDEPGMQEHLHQIAEILLNTDALEDGAKAHLVWQIDGMPMSGDLAPGTARSSVRFAQTVETWNLPGYLQLAGGTNDTSVERATECNLAIAGIGYGSYARQLVQSYSELDPLIDRPTDLAEAVQCAKKLVQQLKHRCAMAHDDIVMTHIEETRVTDDLEKLLAILPPLLQEILRAHPRLDELIEVVMDLGRPPEARFREGAEYLTEAVITQAELDHSAASVGEFSGDNRAGIERTLHRISAMRNRHGKIIGLTCRVGRAVFGTIGMIGDLVESGKSILLLGRPGVGKTTALREIARVLADDLHKRVVIIDTSNEIAGDGDIPHAAIGRARRMQVARPENQHQVMIEAVENHMPEVIVIDEIGTELEALAARTIAERGVMLVGTAHGNKLDNLIKNPTLSDLIGGIQTVTLGDDEARRRGTQKSVLERKASPTFEIAIEMQERYKWTIHKDVAETIDFLLRDRKPQPETRAVNSQGKVSVSKEAPPPPTWDEPKTTHWGEQAQLYALPSMNIDVATAEGQRVCIYPYAVSRSHLERIISALGYPVTLTKEIDDADVVLALRSHVRDKGKITSVAHSRQIPVYTVKANTIAHITRALRRILQIDEPGVPPDLDTGVFGTLDSDDELEAMEEARLAVEQVVLPKGQPVELLPRAPHIRKMQHELVEHYRLKSESFGQEPNRRLRIYPE